MLSRYAPWFAGDDLLRPLLPLFDLALPFTEGRLAATAPAGPSVDIVEKADALELTCDVPGCGPDDVNVTFEGGVLTIQARRTIDHANASVRMAERYQGEFTRSFALGDAYDPDRVSATLRNGVLVVEVAKRPEAAPRKIPIHFGAEGANKQLGAQTETAPPSA